MRKLWLIFFGKLQRAAEAQALTDFQGDLFLDADDPSLASKPIFHL
jgi:hypothetical protein